MAQEDIDVVNNIANIDGVVEEQKENVGDNVIPAEPVINPNVLNLDPMFPTHWAVNPLRFDWHPSAIYLFVQTKANDTFLVSLQPWNQLSIWHKHRYLFNLDFNFQNEEEFVNKFWAIAVHFNWRWAAGNDIIDIRRKTQIVNEYFAVLRDCMVNAYVENRVNQDFPEQVLNKTIAVPKRQGSLNTLDKVKNLVVTRYTKRLGHDCFTFSIVSQHDTSDHTTFEYNLNIIDHYAAIPHENGQWFKLFAPKLHGCLLGRPNALKHPLIVNKVKIIKAQQPLDIDVPVQIQQQPPNAQNDYNRLANIVEILANSINTMHLQRNNNGQRQSSKAIENKRIDCMYKIPFKYNGMNDMKLKMNWFLKAHAWIQNNCLNQAWDDRVALSTLKLTLTDDAATFMSNAVNVDSWVSCNDLIKWFIEEFTNKTMHTTLFHNLENFFLPDSYEPEKIIPYLNQQCKHLEIAVNAANLAVEEQPNWIFNDRDKDRWCDKRFKYYRNGAIVKGMNVANSTYSSDDPKRLFMNVAGFSAFIIHYLKTLDCINFNKKSKFQDPVSVTGYNNNALSGSNNNNNSNMNYSQHSQSDGYANKTQYTKYNNNENNQFNGYQPPCVNLGAIGTTQHCNTCNQNNLRNKEHRSCDHDFIAAFYPVLLQINLTDQQWNFARNSICARAYCDNNNFNFNNRFTLLRNARRYVEMNGITPVGRRNEYKNKTMPIQNVNFSTMNDNRGRGRGRGRDRGRGRGKRRFNNYSINNNNNNNNNTVVPSAQPPQPPPNLRSYRSMADMNGNQTH